MERGGLGDSESHERTAGELQNRWRQAVFEVRRTLEECGRPPDSAEILCVTKTQPPEKIEPLLSAGVRLFGENRVQEAKAKWTPIKRRIPGLRLHLIGPLQRNKVDDALALFDAIETVDRLRLARLLSEKAQSGIALPELFIQVNTGSEPQKSGIAPQEADEFIRVCRSELRLPIVGLMAIPPFHEPAAPHFALLAQIARRHELDRLSMGMTADYGAALQLGATEVRLGGAIFGPRI